MQFPHSYSKTESSYIKIYENWLNPVLVTIDFGFEVDFIVIFDSSIDTICWSTKGRQIVVHILKCFKSRNRSLLIKACANYERPILE